MSNSSPKENTLFPVMNSTFIFFNIQYSQSFSPPLCSKLLVLFRFLTVIFHAIFFPYKELCLSLTWHIIQHDSFPTDTNCFFHITLEPTYDSLALSIYYIHRFKFLFNISHIICKLLPHLHSEILRCLLSIYIYIFLI